MSIEDVEKELLRQRVGDVTEDAAALVAEVLQVPRDTVVRISYALQTLKRADIHAFIRHQHDELDPELRQAIQYALFHGVVRAVAARAIRESGTMTINVDAMLAPNQEHKICEGCPERIECIADSLHTPDECFHDRKDRFPVYPIRLTKDHVIVEAAQPAGTFEVPLRKIALKMTKEIDR